MGGVLSQIIKFCPVIVEIYQKWRKPDFETLWFTVMALYFSDFSKIQQNWLPQQKLLETSELPYKANCTYYLALLKEFSLQLCLLSLLYIFYIIKITLDIL